MKIAFVNDWSQHIALQIIAAFLKKNGHKVKVFIEPSLFSDIWVSVPSLHKILDFKKFLYQEEKKEKRIHIVHIIPEEEFIVNNPSLDHIYEPEEFGAEKLIVKMAKSMTKAVTMKDDYIIKVLAAAHFVFVVLVLLMTLVVM